VLTYLLTSISPGFNTESVGQPTIQLHSQSCILSTVESFCINYMLHCFLQLMVNTFYVVQVYCTVALMCF